MRYKVLLVEVFAIVAAYLIVTLPAASATQVSVMYKLGEDWLTYKTVNLNPSNYITILKSIIGNRVTINVTNSTNEYDMERMYLFRCRGKDPAECVDTISPDSEPNVIYNWNEIADVSGTANLLFLVKLIGEDFFPWTGFWHTIENKIPQADYSLGSMNAYSQYNYRGSTRQWIPQDLSIPFSWLENPYTAFTSTSKIYGVETDDFSSFLTETIAGDSITSIGKRFYFAFPESGDGKIMNPITLYSSPPAECGNYICELGEDQNNCCYDCGCPGGQYCDTGGGVDGVCRPEAIVGLGVTKVSQSAFSDCNVQHDLELTVKINYPPTNTQVQAMSYKLDGTSYTSVTCEDLGNYYYKCPVTVPAFPFGSMPDCGTGSYIVGSNKVKFLISYYDGSTLKSSQPIETGFDDITIGSYVCGQNGCEPGLGESSSNCCYDCGCSSGQYCDTGSAVQGSFCRPDVTNSNFIITDIDPTHFITHQPGDTFDVSSEITSAPSTLDVDIGNAKCSLDCISRYAGGLEEVCEVSCNPSCTGSITDGSYESECTASFSITLPAYDSGKSYTLTPTLNYTVSYSDGPQVITKDLSATGQSISIGANYCGDGDCTQEIGETSSNCCYDCGCPNEQYCDTQTSSGPTVGTDVCKSETNISLEIANIEPDPMSFGDYTEENIISFNAYIHNPPSGMDYFYNCTFGDGNDVIQCDEIDCEYLESESSDDLYNMSCSITIDLGADFDYESSGFYDSGTQLIIISPNQLDFPITYNNGPDTASKDLTAPLDEIKMAVVHHCGTGVGYGAGDEQCQPSDRAAACETSLGESQQTCCCDCGCDSYGTDYYCQYDQDDPLDYGQCLSTSQIALVIDHFDPDPVTCIIGLDDVCKFTGTTYVYSNMVNEPADVEIAEAYYDYKGESYDTNCHKIESGEYVCGILLPDMNSTEPEGLQPVDIYFTIDYTKNDQRFIQNISTQGYVNITKEKSDALLECEEITRRLQQEERKLSDSQASTMNYVMTGIGLFLLLQALCCITCLLIPNPVSCWCCIFASWWWAAGTFAVGLAMQWCVSQDVDDNEEEIKRDIEVLRQQKEAICGGGDYDSIKNNIMLSNMMGNSMGATSGTISALCTVVYIVGVIMASMIVIAWVGPAVSWVFGAAEPAATVPVDLSKYTIQQLGPTPMA